MCVYLPQQDMQLQIHHSIEQFPVSDGQGPWQSSLHRSAIVHDMGGHWSVVC